MILIPKIRQRLGWLTHCYKAVVLRYHHQLLPIFDLIVKPDDLVIDVGAHVGQFSKIFSKPGLFTLKTYYTSFFQILLFFKDKKMKLHLKIM